MSTVIVSPHLDDAVLSLGQWIAAHHDVTIVTVFAGVPGDLPLTHYDAQCGFGSGTEAMLARLLEDSGATFVLGCQRNRLDFFDQQYGIANDRGEMEKAIARAMGACGRALIPLGLVHADHVAVSDLAFPIACEYAATVSLYEELPYRVLHPELTAERLAGWRERFTLETSPEPSGERSRKIAALGCYRSQVPDPLEPTLLVPERIWSVS